jgi:hypothetical protein
MIAPIKPSIISNASITISEFVRDFLNSLMWKTAGNMNASKVQHDDPTRAINVEKFGIRRTINPVNNTRTALNTHPA